MRHSYIADAHGYISDDDQRQYLKHSLEQSESPQIEYITQSNTFSYANNNTLDIPPAFFCSIFDIQTIERQTTNNIAEYILNQIGCGKVFQLYQRLLEFNDLILALIEYDSIPNKCRSAAPDTSSYGNQSRKAKKNSIFKLLYDKYGITKDAGRQLFQNLKWKETDLSRFREVCDYLKGTLDTDLKKIKSVAKNVMPDIMNDFLEKDCTLDITYDNLSFRIDLKVGSDEKFDTPRRYFNTFRFKLYVAALKVSLACCVKIIHKINFPTVLDDVFDASDFRHKLEIREFVKNIILNHNKVLSKSYSSMQLLFMSQDDMIATNAYQGICDANDISFNSNKRTLAKFCRLYPYIEINRNDDLINVNNTIVYHKVFYTIESNF